MFGARLGPPDLGSITDANFVAPARIDLAQVSFLSTPALDALQDTTSFVLATVVFRGVALGTHEISLAQILLGDHLGASLALDVAALPLLIEVVVPEPATTALLAAGLACFVTVL